jgi:hypothetical protein
MPGVSKDFIFFNQISWEGMGGGIDRRGSTRAEWR